MRRLVYLDRFRFLVVTLAILSHVIVKHRVLDFELQQAALWLTLAARTATPSLLTILGVMVAIVYGPRFDADPGRTSRRILRRALQCYAAFLAIVATGLASGGHDVATALLALPFLAPVDNGGIFQLYVLLLPATILLLHLRARFGAAGLVGAALGVWALAPALGLLDGRWPEALRVHGSLVFGIGGEWGPTAFHGLSLVAFGMLVGAAMVGEPRTRRENLVGAGLLAALAIAVVALDVARIGPHAFAGAIVHFGLYRAHNAPEYYAFGVAAALALLLAARLVSPRLPDRPLAPVDRLGGLTLTYFLIGEMLILLLPDPPIARIRHLVLSSAIHVGLAAAATLLVHRLLAERRRAVERAAARAG